MATQSQFLTDFYKAYEDWADLGAPDSEIFSNKVGLCKNLHRYLTRVTGDMSPWRISMEMDFQFSKAGLSPVYPFNDEYGDDYDDDINNGMTKNPKRMAWVRDHAKL